MKRIRIIFVNLGLMVFSLVLLHGILQGCDFAAARYLQHHFDATKTGLLFTPGQEAWSEMHDYSCYEKVNSLGIRDHEFSLKKGDKYRIVCIGDSFTYGWGVNLEDTWCKHLEDYLQHNGLNVEVLNLGKPASGPIEYSRIAELLTPILKPDLIIVGLLNGDDIQQCISPLVSMLFAYPNLVQLFHYYRTLHQAGPISPEKQTAEQMRAWYIDSAKSMLNEMSASSKVNYNALDPAVKEAFINGYLNPWMISQSCGEPTYFLNTSHIDQLKWPIFFMGHELKKIRKTAARNHADVIAISIPEGFLVNKEAYTNLPRIGFLTEPAMLTTHAVDDAIKMACDDARIPFYCVTDEMRQFMDKKGVYLEMDRHMTALGNKLYADLISPIIAKEVTPLLHPTPAR